MGTARPISRAPDQKCNDFCGRPWNSGKNRQPVLAALTMTPRQLAPLEIPILGPQTQALHEAHPRSVKQTPADASKPPPSTRQPDSQETPEPHPPPSPEDDNDREKQRNGAPTRHKYIRSLCCSAYSESLSGRAQARSRIGSTPCRTCQSKCTAYKHSDLSLTI